MADKWAQRGRKPKGSMSAWGKPQKTRMHLAPPGLKGKAIGMYFKNQAKLKGEEYKKNRELVVTFKIPPTVQAQVNKNLESIAKISGKPRIKIQVPEKKVESEPKCNPENTQVKSEPEPMSEHDFSSDVEIDVFKKPEIPKEKVIKEEKIDDEPKPSTSSSFLSLSDFIPVRKEDPSQFGSGERLLALRGSVEYKYSYEDIITGTFDEKLNESLSNGININLQSSEVLKLHDKLYDDYLDMLDKPMYKKMFKFRELLPTYKKSKDLLDTINNNQVVVISGETGCGKSTQVPQLILDEAILNKKAGNIKILVTQPRRIAASSLALRVAEERGEKPGNSVGYAVRLEKIEARSRGSIMFFTTGVLLSTLEVDQGLTDYSHIILDEVHERDCNIDLSMCMLKKVMQKRKDLKLILMSATIDSEKLSEYFDNCPMLHIEGLAFPVKDIYLEEVLEMTQFQLPPVQEKKQPKWGRHKNTRANEMEKDIKYKAEIAPWLESVKSSLSRETYTTLQDSRIENINVDLICQLILKICQGPPGALLVFLPGINEITKLITFMNKAGSFHKSQYEIYPLHSKLPSLEQHKIFERPPEGVRKIIIATNIAETSITIDDVVYVIDCARLKLKGLDVEEHVSTLQIEWISEANLRQRRGRAGRCQPGVCYHLMTKYRASQIAPRLLPELKRSDLLEALLTVKRLRLGKAADAFVEVPSPPDETTVKRAVQHLQRCGALDEKETLTPLGWHLARLPVHPSAGKLLLLGALFGCLDRAASVAAVWGFKDPFQLVIGKEHEVDQMKRQLALGEPSDQIAISEAVIQWEKCPPHARYNFAYEYFLSHKTLELLSEMKAQLGESLKNMGFLGDNDVKSPWENRNSDNLSLFKALVAAALYPNVYSARWTHLNSRKRVPALAVNTTNMNERNKVFIHPSSVMAARDSNTPLCNKAGANWLVYWLKQKSSDLFLLEVTLVYSLPLLFFGELQVTVKPVDDEDDPTVDNYFLHISNIKVKMPREAAHSIFELRSLLDEVLASKVMGSAVHAVRHSQFEEAVLNAVIQLITAEDERNEDQQDDTSESDHSESDSSQMSYQGRPDYDRPRNRPHFDGRPGRSHYEERQGRPHFQGRHGGPPRGRPYGHGYNSHANWQPNVNHDYTNYYPN